MTAREFLNVINTYDLEESIVELEFGNKVYSLDTSTDYLLDRNLKETRIHVNYDDSDYVIITLVLKGV